MRIDNSNKVTGSITTGSQPSVKGNGSKGNNLSTDNVELSSLQVIGNSLANIPDIDVARIEEVKQAIAQGRFKVNPEIVADKLLETVKELIQSHKE